MKPILITLVCVALVAIPFAIPLVFWFVDRRSRAGELELLRRLSGRHTDPRLRREILRGLVHRMRGGAR